MSALSIENEIILWQLDIIRCQFVRRNGRISKTGKCSYRIRGVNREYVEFMIRDYNKPMGVATYKTADEMPENIRKALPDIEELKKLLGS